LPFDDVHVLVTFYSRGGLTERIAVWLAEGALQAGAKIRLRRARDIAAEEAVVHDPEWLANRDRMHEEFAAPTLADAEWAHVLAFGTPAAAGLLSPELGAYLDRFRKGELSGKIGTAFTSGYSERETALMSLQMAMLRMELTVIPAAGGVASSGGSNEWELAHAQGTQAVMIARALNQAKGREGST
jgi:NAD(P)H dehydrogenase (quinone)